MGFFDNAQEMLDKGVSVAKGAVSGVAVEQLGFVRGFARLCQDGWAQGWHERNGGNVTYRMTAEDVQGARSFFYDTPSSWVPLGMQVPTMGGAYLLATATGAFLRNVALDVDANAGIVELDAAGAAWRVVWGFKGGGKPTSELASHVLIHAVRRAATDDACRVLYHAHPVNVVALSAIMPLDARQVTRTLWKTMAECIIAVPTGIGVVPWMVPGSAELAQATGQVMKDHAACLWAQHGLFCSGSSFDDAFGAMHAVEKAAAAYLLARTACGSADIPNTISDQGLRDIAARYALQVNQDYLD